MKYVAPFGAAPPQPGVRNGGRQDLNAAIYSPFAVINIHDRSSSNEAPPRHVFNDDY